MSLRQSPKPQTSTDSETSKSTLRCTRAYESEADAKIISGKWVLKPHKA